MSRGCGGLSPLINIFFFVQSVYKMSCATHFHMSSLSSLFFEITNAEKSIVISHGGGVRWREHGGACVG